MITRTHGRQQALRRAFKATLGFRGRLTGWTRTIIGLALVLALGTGCENKVDEKNKKIDFHNQIMGAYKRFRAVEKKYLITCVTGSQDLVKDGKQAETIQKNAADDYKQLVDELEAIKSEAETIKAPPGKESEDLRQAFLKYTKDCEECVKTIDKEHQDLLIWNPDRGQLSNDDEIERMRHRNELRRQHTSRNDVRDRRLGDALEAYLKYAQEQK